MTEGGLEQAGRERDLDRLLTFVDAIVAIAITLLVLPLVDLTADITADDRVGHVLHEHASDLWSFALSFDVIARIWMGQHEVVGPLVADSGRVTALLLVWSFTVVVQPFSTSLVARAGSRSPRRCTSARWHSASSSSGCSGSRSPDTPSSRTRRSGAARSARSPRPASWWWRWR